MKFIRVDYSFLYPFFLLILAYLSLFLFCFVFDTRLNHRFLFQEFSPGSNGRMTTMGVYVRDLLLGQVSGSELPTCFTKNVTLLSTCQLAPYLRNCTI